MKNAGERIKTSRIKAGFTQDDVAKYLGIGKQAVCKYENGTVTNIPLENLQKMAVMFETSPGYLAGWEDAPASSSSGLSQAEIRFIHAYRAADERARSDALNLMLDHPA